MPVLKCFDCEYWNDCFEVYSEGKKVICKYE